MLERIMLTAAALALSVTFAEAKQYSIQYGTSCESATFKQIKTDPNLWQYTGNGTDLCANFIGLGFKVKAKLEGLDSTWLMFSIHSNDGDFFPKNVESVAVQWPIVSGSHYVLYGTDGHSVQVDTGGTYTVLP